MSDAELNVLLKARDELSGTLQKVQGELDKTQRATDQSSGGFTRLRDAAAKIGPVLLGAGAALAGIAAVAIKAASENETAQRRLQDSLGLTAEEAVSMGEVVQAVYRENWGGSIAEVGTAVAAVKQQFRDLDGGAVAELTVKAFKLQDVFAVDVQDSVSTVRTLMEQFGLTSEQAFDFLTKGFQSGLDRSGDFLDTINEYSTQFANGGATASEFFSLLESGLQGGMLGTDKAADAFKEFRVRIQDGSKATSEGLAQLGIDSTDLAQKMAGGQMTAAQAFQLVLDKLRETEDQNVVMQAGVALIGTQFEDLGTKSALALDLTRTSLDSATGSTDALQGSATKLEEVQRKLDVLLGRLGSVLLPLVSSGLDQVSTAFDIANVLIEQAGTIVTYLQETGLTGLWNILRNLSPDIDLFGQGIDAWGGIISGAGGALQRLVGWLNSVWEAAQRAWSALSRVTGGGIRIPGFASGGIVPGPIGAPQLAIVHGGERVIPAGPGGPGSGGGGQVVINFNGPVWGLDDLDRQMAAAFNRVYRRGGFPYLRGA